ncbi:MAG: hypothetical protein IT370_18060 [Deltaproteobacteria bacterium]|nr:hypothetical protein [Deltaproteobacteria bacterium]
MLCLIGGALAAASFIVAKKPDAKKAMDKIAPYQGIIGVIALIWGLYDTYFWLLGTEGSFVRKIFTSGFPGIPGKYKLLGYSMYWVGILQILLGVLLGYGLIASKVGGKNPEMAAKGEAMQKKLAGIQTPLGFVAIITGAIWLLCAF